MTRRLVLAAVIAGLCGCGSSDADSPLDAGPVPPADVVTSGDTTVLDTMAPLDTMVIADAGPPANDLPARGDASSEDVVRAGEDAGCVAGTPCDDGDLTTRDDACDGAGACVGTPYECVAALCQDSATHNGSDCDVVFAPVGSACGDLEKGDCDVCDGAGGCAAAEAPGKSCEDAPFVASGCLAGVKSVAEYEDVLMSGAGYICGEYDDPGAEATYRISGPIGGTLLGLGLRYPDRVAVSAIIWKAAPTRERSDRSRSHIGKR